MGLRRTRIYLISGRVQGVGYRSFAQRAARDLRVGGWVRNLDDGRVEVLGTGSGRQLDEFEGELRLGPPVADVRHVHVKDSVEDSAMEDVRIEGFHIR